MPTCDYSQFKCNSGQCVEAAKLCDGQFNCKDHSDEDPNICALHYRCQSGFYRLSKHRCNGFTDCPVSEDDEINCGKPCDASQMMCRSGRCINETNVCDFHCDCQYCEDEEGCDQTYCDLSSHFICLKANRCLHSRYICDGVDNCMDKDIGSDENFCSANITECFTALRKSGYSFPMSQMFHCKDGRCMLTRHQCNTVQECFGGDDELNCTFPACAPDEFRCGGGDCVKGHQVCNNQRDCKDWSDEKDCSQKICSADQKQCSSGHCIPSHYWCDRFPDCRDGSDERDCQYRKCLPDEFTCANGQCVPLRMFCYNGTAGQNRGCRDGSNLLNCSQHTCQDPQNQFKCHRSYCIDKTQVCNNVWDCVFNYYDEQECNYICPAGSNLCICHNQEMFCDHRNLTQLPLPISKEQINKLNYQGNKLGYNLRTDSLSKGGTNMDKVIYVDLSNNLITDIPAYMFQYMYSVKTLNLADNNITEIKNVSLIGLGALTQLYLHGNAIQSLDKYSFMNLSNLITLDLSSQRITRLSPQTFVGLDSLRMLNLSGNQLKTIEDGTFYGLHNLLTLDISNNMIQTIGKRVFYNLPKLTHLITDKFKFCCLAKNVKSCLPMPDEFSSCGHLMDNYILRIFIWILGLIAFFGNVVVIGWRIRDMRGRKVHSILITNLALGDLMMGIYLLIVAVVDTYYRDVYIAHDEEWRHSALCKFAGFISTFSSELSVFTLTIITIDRLICIILPLRMTRLSVREATYTMLFIWLLVFFISVVPLMDIPYFQNFYGRSGVCLALHITPQRPPGWQFSVAIFLVLNFVSFLIIALSYVWMFLVARETRSAVRSIETKNDTAMARRMTLIVMTDFACWIPIIILGFVSLAGGNASNDVYAWIAVFVLPLNSAINPVLYTLSTAPFLMNFRSRVCRFRKSSMSQETNHSYV
ncbi:G-protein coupled receptor GRL101, partial [Biomphalaria glabrata]